MQFGREIRGFTLIELLVTLVVLATLLGIAIPSFSSQIKNNRSVAVAEDLLAALNFTRSEAVKRGARTSVCASNNGISCVGSWTDGWMVFVDGAVEDTASDFVVETVIRVWEAPHADAVISFQRDSTNTNLVRYNSRGALALRGNIVVLSKVAGCSGSSGRAITINRGGMPLILQEPCI